MLRAMPPSDLDTIEEVVVIAGRDLVMTRPADAEALLDEDAFARDEFMPYWAELWPSAHALARWVGVRALHGARVLELGCGLGLPSLVAASRGASVVATDVEPAALELLTRNAALNGVEVETMLVDWGSPDALVDRAPFDLALAADVLYEPAAVEPLLSLLPRLAPRVWLADPGRAPADGFGDRLRGMEVRRIDAESG